jgi:hypothetical protein
LDQHTSQNEDLLFVGALYARDTQALCNDVAAVIFPTAIAPPTDVTTSAVTLKLVQIVTDIERRLQRLGYTSALQPATWPLLAQSGFLREADLVDFALARVAEDRLEARLNMTTVSLPAQLLDHPDGNVAEAAQILMAADSLHRRSRGSTYLGLPAELLHKLCWRVVAALEVFHGSRSPDIIAAAREIIAGYDEGQTTAAAARKIVHFVGQPHRDTLLKPELAGLHLYVASLSAALNIDHDHVLRLIDAGSSAPFAVMMSALDLPKEHAIALIFLLRGEALTSREAGIFDRGYNALDQQVVRSALSTWSMARTQFLAFGT